MMIRAKVQDSDIIGAVTNGNYSGLQALATTFGTMGFFSKLLVAPGYWQNADVATAMLGLAVNFRAIALIDSPPSTDTGHGDCEWGSGWECIRHELIACGALLSAGDFL